MKLISTSTIQTTNFSLFIITCIITPFFIVTILSNLLLKCKEYFLKKFKHANT